MSFSVVVLSRNSYNLSACVAALQDGVTRIIVVDDGLELHPNDCRIQYVTGEKPFVFARNANIGIGATGTDDVILMNDDAVLVYGSLSNLIQFAVSSHGIISASVRGVVNNHEQVERGLKTGQLQFITSGYLAFVCVAIPRAVLNRVGLLDERFVTYGGEDVDYCHRAGLAKIPLGIHLQTVVDHGKILPSTFRSTSVPDIEPGLKLLRDKWVNGTVSQNEDLPLTKTLSL